MGALLDLKTRNRCNFIDVWAERLLSWLLKNQTFLIAKNSYQKQCNHTSAEDKEKPVATHFDFLFRHQVQKLLHEKLYQCKLHVLQDNLRNVFLQLMKLYCGYTQWYGTKYLYLNLHIIALVKVGTSVVSVASIALIISSPENPCFSNSDKTSAAADNSIKIYDWIIVWIFHNSDSFWIKQKNLS